MVELVGLYLFFLIMFIIFCLAELLIGNEGLAKDVKKLQNNTEEIKSILNRIYEQEFKKLVNIIDITINKFRRKK